MRVVFTSFFPLLRAPAVASFNVVIRAQARVIAPPRIRVRARPACRGVLVNNNERLTAVRKRCYER